MNVWTFLLSALANLLGSLGGVSLAFYLERRRERSQSVNTYLEQLYASYQELDLLREQSEKTIAALGRGDISTISFDAPLLQSLLSGSGIQRHGDRGLIVCAASLSRYFKTIDNELAYFRSQGSLPGPAVAYVKSGLDQAARLTKYVHGLFTDELKRLGHQEKRTPEDEAVISGLLKAARREPPPLDSLFRP